MGRIVSTLRMGRMVNLVRRDLKESPVETALMAFLEQADRKVLGEKSARKDRRVTLALLATKAPLEKLVLQDLEENEVIEVMWDLLDQWDRLGLLDPKEFRGLRARLVRLELRVIPEQTEVVAL